MDISREGLQTKGITVLLQFALMIRELVTTMSSLSMCSQLYILDITMITTIDMNMITDKGIRQKLLLFLAEIPVLAMLSWLLNCKMLP